MSECERGRGVALLFTYHLGRGEERAVHFVVTRQTRPDRVVSLFLFEGIFLDNRFVAPWT
ncbi:UNVERIFIED_CONTAM: hypothetical protein FKN15_056089 [Acipenser sinensis]